MYFRCYMSMFQLDERFINVECFNHQWREGTEQRYYLLRLAGDTYQCPLCDFR